MKSLLQLMFVLSSLAALPVATLAQQADNHLNDSQILGRRVFQQRCGVCHGEATITSKRNGPALYKDLIDGNEDVLRETIMKGRSGLMPGFQYGLKPVEINAILEYLKTVPRPVKAKAGSNGVDVTD